MCQKGMQNEAVLEFGSCVGADNTDKKLMDFYAMFLNRTAEDRRSFLALAERELSDFPDEYKNLAIEILRLFCEVADEREGERRGAVKRRVL